MGSLAGHVIPGVFFLIYGIAWMFLSFWLHLTTSHTKALPSKKGKSSKLQPTPSSTQSYADYKREMELSRKSYIPLPFLRGFPLESLIKGVFSLIGIIVEAFFDITQTDHKLIFTVVKFKDDDGHFINMNKLHHVTMYACFFLSAVIDFTSLVIRLPKATTKLFISLAFAIEGLLFWFHTSGDAGLDYGIHLLLILTIIICIAFNSLRMLTPSNILINAGMSFSMNIQGSWFIHLGVIMYGPTSPWSSAEHESLMYAIALFSWHVIIIMSIMLLVYIAMMACFKTSIRHKGRIRQNLSNLPVTLFQEHNKMPEKEKLISEEIELIKVEEDDKRNEESVALIDSANL
jgi:hypothetical protein